MHKTVTITKTEYKKILKSQDELNSRLNDLQRVVLEIAREEEVRPSVLKRWKKRMLDADHGKGECFNNLSSFQKYLQAL